MLKGKKFNAFALKLLGLFKLWYMSCDYTAFVI